MGVANSNPFSGGGECPNTSYSKVTTYREILYLKYQKLQRKVDIHNEESPNSVVLANALNELGELYLEQGYYDAALEEFLKSIVLLAQLEPNSVLLSTVQFNIGKVYIVKKLYSNALKVLNDSLAIRLSLCTESVLVAQVYEGLVHVQRKLNMTEQAMEYVTLEKNLVDTLYNNVMKNNNSTTSPRLELAKYLHQSGKHTLMEYFDETSTNQEENNDHLLAIATERLKLAISLIKGRNEYKELLARLLLDSGEVKVMQLHPQESIEVYLSVITICEELTNNSNNINSEVNVDLMILLAEAHKRVGDVVIRSIDNNDPLVILVPNNGIQSVINPLKALRVDKSASNTKAPTIDVDGLLVFSLQHYKQTEIIIEMFNPHSIKAADLFNAIGDLYRRQKVFPSAVKYLTKRLDIITKEQPKTEILVNAHHVLADVLFSDCNDTKNALLHYQLAAENLEVLHPDSVSVAMAYVKIGLVYKDQGYPSTALTEFQKALSICVTINPNSEEVKIINGHITALARRPKVTVSYV